jgi:diaminopimelate epimerase
VQTHGGELTISWAGAGQPVRMTVPAAFVFDGTIDLPDLP